VAPTWPALPVEPWRDTYDTLHAHSQVLGRLAAALRPPEPELQHAALRLTARGWETGTLTAPNGTGALVVALDLHAHETVIEHSRGETRRVPLTPDRAVGAVTVEVLAGIRELAGEVEIRTAPAEVPWTVPLDEDEEHHTYDPAQVAVYFEAATRAALALAEYRAPYRGRKTAVNAWWGSFDLAVSVFSGAQELAAGWWPGDGRYPRAAFYAYVHPAQPGFEEAPVGRWDGELGELVLDWDDVVAAPDPEAAALAFLRSTARHGCAVCNWDPALAASIDDSHVVQ